MPVGGQGEISAEPERALRSSFEVCQQMDWDRFPRCLTEIRRTDPPGALPRLGVSARCSELGSASIGSRPCQEIYQLATDRSWSILTPNTNCATFIFPMWEKRINRPDTRFGLECG